MPRPAAITKSTVIEACETLVANGQAPSVTRLRHILGRGSYTTIARFRREWEEETASSNAQEESEPPAELLRAAERIARDAWRRAREEAEADLAQERSKLEEDRRKAFAELESSMMLIDSFEEQCRQLAYRNEQIQTELDTTRFNRNWARNEMARLEKMVEDLTRERDRKSKRVDLLEKAALDRKEMMVNTQGMLNRLNEEHKELKEAHKRGKEERDALNAAHQELKERAARLEQLEVDLRERIAERSEMLKNETAQVRRLEEKANELTVQVIRLQRECSDHENAKADLQSRLEKEVETNANLAHELKARPRDGDEGEGRQKPKSTPRKG